MGVVVERAGVSVLYLDLVFKKVLLEPSKEFKCVTKFSQKRKDGTGLHFAGVVDDW